jgi:hypothetical protein
VFLPGRIIQAADILTWDLVKTMLHKSLDPVMEDVDNWLSHVEDDIINQLEIDRSPLLMVSSTMSQRSLEQEL